MAPVKLNVLTMVESIGYADGGAERLAVKIATELDPERFDSAICATRWRAEHAVRDDVSTAIADLDAAGVELIRLRRRNRFDMREWLKLARLIRSWPVHVLHSHMFGSNVWGAVLGSLCRTPVTVAHEHMWSFEGAPIRRFFDRDVIARGSDAFLTVSEQSRQMMIELERIPPQRLRALTNGIPARPPGDGPAARARLGIGAEDFVVGSVGLLRPEKAFEVLVDAGRLIADGADRTRVVIVGDGPDRVALEARIRAQGVEDIVVLTGIRLDVPDLLAAFDVAVCCSDWEGGPLSIMEYMQAGVPVVATAVGGIPEMIEDGRHGLLVPSRDPIALSQGILRLRSDPRLAGELAACALDKQKREYDLETMVRELERLYEQLYERGRS